MLAQGRGARHVKHVPGRTKTDVQDCQWIRKLHSFVLLNGSFRPDHQIRKLRTYMRLHDNLVVSHTEAVHHMQKALFSAAGIIALLPNDALIRKLPA